MKMSVLSGLLITLRRLASLERWASNLSSMDLKSAVRRLHGLVTLDYPKGKSLPTIDPSPAAMKVNPGLELTACLMSTVTVLELQGTSVEGVEEGIHLCMQVVTPGCKR